MLQTAGVLTPAAAQVGQYTDRGGQQCGPSPGSLVHELLDSNLFAAQGFDYVKSDDCNDSLTYETGMANCDALKAANRDIFFEICASS